MNENTYGYILIDTPEKKKQFGPRLNTDEFLANGFWRPVAFLSGSPALFSDGDTYRRRIDPGEGYEIVPRDATVTPDMQVMAELFGIGNWNEQEWATVQPGCNVQWVLQFPGNTILAFRRKKTAPLTIDVLRDSILSWLNAVGAQAGHRTADDFQNGESRRLAQLLNWKAPKSADEVAFEKEYDAICASVSGCEGVKVTPATRARGMRLWNAALKHARQ